MSYTPLLRRIREDKTNYRKRKAILIGRYNFTVVRVSDQNVQIQVLKPSKKGDEVLVSVHSRELIKHGWKGSRKSIPACYLTGLLAGTKAIANNVNKCILYTGNRIYSTKIAASVKGLLDAGVIIPIGEDTIPPENRLNGNHIADYAKYLKENDNQLYITRFSAIIKEGFIPENYNENVERTKSSILGKLLAKEEANEVKAVTKTKIESKGSKQPKVKESKKNKEGGKS